MKSWIDKLSPIARVPIRIVSVSLAIAPLYATGIITENLFLFVYGMVVLSFLALMVFLKEICDPKIRSARFG